MVRTKKCLLLSVFNCLISFVASIQKIEIETISSFPIQRSQLRNGETTVLQNFYDIQYYTFINMGTPGQTQKVLLDTGSGLLWVPAVNCSNCASQALKFNSSQSQTFTDLNQKHKIQYLKGEANGIMGEDFVTFQNFKVYAKFMLAEQEGDLGGSKFDGIMGLSNDHSYKNVFQIGYRENLLVSSTFAFQLGLRYLKKKSYFYYNITKQDFPNAYFIPTSRKNKWMIPIKGIHVNNVRYNVSQVLIDTGTSLTLLPPKQYDQLENDVFSRFCFPSTSNYAYIQDVGLRYCSCKFVDYPNITFVTSGISFNLTPTMYIFGLSQGSQKCYLGIENSQTSMAILGDNFLQHNTVIFNKQTQEIGFIGNYNQLFQYIDSSDILTTLTVVWIMMVVAIIGMLCWLQEEENTTSLRQSLTVPENKIKQTIQVM